MGGTMEQIGSGPRLRDVVEALRKARAGEGSEAEVKAKIRSAFRGSGEGPRYACNACSDQGLVSVRKNGSDFAAKCLCAKGQALGLKVALVSEVLSEVELFQMFPQGQPAEVDTVGPRLARAGLPARGRNWSLESYKSHFANVPKAVQYAAWVPLWASKSLGDRGDIMLVGTNGTGKSGLSVGLARECLQRGETVRWWYVPDLFTAWRATFSAEESGAEQAFQKRLVEVDVLILDEFSGAAMTDFVQQTLTTVIHLRQQAMRPTVLTMNVGVGADGSVDQFQLTQLLGPALADRLREHGQLWPLTGASQRPTFKRTR